MFNLFSNLIIVWSQVFALLFLATLGALLAELVVGNAPRFGFFGAIVLAILGSWIFINIPLDFSLEPRLEDFPVVRGILGGFLMVSLFAFLRKQGAVR